MDPVLVVSPNIKGLTLIEHINTKGREIADRLEALEKLEITKQLIISELDVQSINTEYLVESDPGNINLYHFFITNSKLTRFYIDGFHKVTKALNNLKRIVHILKEYDLGGIKVSYTRSKNLFKC